MKRKNLLFIISLLLLLILPLTTRAEVNTKFYFGVLGNRSNSTFTGDKGNDLSNGDTKSKLNPSLIIGIETRKDKTENGNLKFLLGGEVYYDKIDKTIIQSDRKYYTSRVFGYDEAENAGKPIYTTNFLLGIRGKIGYEFFKRVSLYGLVGLNYWDRDMHVPINEIKADPFENNWKFMPSYGFGVGVNLTKNFELSFNYMQVLTTKIDSPASEYYSVECGDTGFTKIGISVITFGLKYKF